MRMFFVRFYNALQCLLDAERKQKLVSESTVPRTRLSLSDQGCRYAHMDGMFESKLGDGKLRLRSGRVTRENMGSDELREGRETGPMTHAAFIELRFCTAVQHSMLQHLAILLS